MELTNEELGTAIKELTLRLAEAVSTLTACIKAVKNTANERIDALADKTTAQIAAMSGRVDLHCAGC